MFIIGTLSVPTTLLTEAKSGLLDGLHPAIAISQFE